MIFIIGEEGMQAIIFLLALCLAVPVFAADQETYTDRDLKKFKYETDEEQENRRIEENRLRQKKLKLEAEERSRDEKGRPEVMERSDEQKCDDYQQRLKELEALIEKVPADIEARARHRSLRLEYIRDCRARR
jgi:hypothetical protein